MLHRLGGSDDRQDRKIRTEATTSEVGNENVISGSLSAENEEEDLFEGDSLSRCSDIVSQDEHQQSYSLEDINRFLDKTGSLWKSQFFPDVDQFINSKGKESCWL